MATTRCKLPETVCGSLQDRPSSPAMARSDAPTASLDSHAQGLLLALLAEIEALGELHEALLDAPDVDLACLRQVGIPYRPTAWFRPRLTAARRQSLSRAARNLERAGLLRRILEPQRERVTHLQLTAQGLATALHLAGPQANPVTVLAGLERTAWGEPLTGAVWRRFWPMPSEPTA